MSFTQVAGVDIVSYFSYGDAVRELDSGVGAILNYLEQLKIDSETLVIFSSDNGGATYAKELGGYILIHILCTLLACCPYIQAWVCTPLHHSFCLPHNVCTLLTNLLTILIPTQTPVI